MAVAFDVRTRSTGGSNSFDNGPITFSHTPVGTPRGVVVLIGMEAGVDQITSVTYGGVTMARLRNDVRTTAEAGQVYSYFLGSGIPTGVQNVTVNATAASNDWAAVCWTFTAAANTVAISNGAVAVSASTNPSLSITPTAQAAIVYALWSGLAATIITAQAGSTHQFGNDLGADVVMFSDKTVGAGGATTMGYTAASDVWAHTAVAVQEAAGGPATRVPLLKSRRRKAPTRRVLSGAGLR